MNANHRFAFEDNCVICPLRRASDFCHLPPDTLERFNEIGHTSLFPGDAVLLGEGQLPPGVFILCSGRAKLSMVARDGKTVILKIALAGTVLGLSAAVSGRPSPVTVTTLGPCQIKFVDTESFLKILKDSSAALNAGMELGREVQGTFMDVHDLLLARSSTEKLARLLLSWVADESGNHDVRLASNFTHEEMAQMIGSSRETVTRLLSEMKRRELIRLEGSTLVIPDRIALQAIVS